ncbi:hypothetical protein SGPA1_31509 [Streptomyces misionensis JCM 4497]
MPVPARTGRLGTGRAQRHLPRQQPRVRHRHRRPGDLLDRRLGDGEADPHPRRAGRAGADLHHRGEPRRCEGVPRARAGVGSGVPRQGPCRARRPAGLRTGPAHRDLGAGERGRQAAAGPDHHPGRTGRGAQRPRPRRPGNRLNRNAYQEEAPL